VEVFYLPTVTGGAIQEFACEVTSKAFFDRFDEELQLGLISDQDCFFERHPRFHFPLCLLLLPLLFLFFLQDCLQSLLQSHNFFLEVPVLLMGPLDLLMTPLDLLMGPLDLLLGLLNLPDSHLEQIFLGLLMLFEGMFEGFHVVVDFLCELIQVAQLILLGFHQPMSMMSYQGQLLFNLENPVHYWVLTVHNLSFLCFRYRL
jgi:hypothetical protein